jgi:hypothetical protein
MPDEVLEAAMPQAAYVPVQKPKLPGRQSASTPYPVCSDAGL